MMDPIKVLVVEDLEIAQKMVKLILMELGCQVDIAENGRKALHLFKEKHYDIVFMDLGLPDMSGFDVSFKIREIEENRHRVPIIALTANLDESHKPRCLDSGMDGFMLKPLTKDSAKSILTKFKSRELIFKGYTIAYDNKVSVEQTLQEIFTDLPYHFTANNGSPFIIDAGSNIGIATLFFKELYPNSKILCFEPDPKAFQLLQENMTNNQIENVSLINAALSSKEGEIDFFGQILVDSPDARGNSIIDTWGLQRTISNTVKVKSVKLSSYINSEVDFLKIDTEGAEQQILEDLAQENKLSFIKEMAIEVHQSEKMKHFNDIDSISALLKNNKFDIEVIRKNTDELLPDEVKNWAKKINPILFNITAKKL